MWASYAVHVGLQAQTAGGSYLGLCPGPRAWLRPPHPHLPQRLAYGVTPENEHHLVAQRNVRQFQVGAAGPLGAGPWRGPSLPPAGHWELEAGPRAVGGAHQGLGLGVGQGRPLCSLGRERRERQMPRPC